MAEVHGICKEEFQPVREVFANNLDVGSDIGASAAVFIDGEPVVDIWGGYFDVSLTRPFDRDSIVQMFSSTKTITAVCALVLADRGEIDLKAPVAKYWPEFAQAGKGEIRVEQLLGYTSGMAGWTEHMTLQDTYDFEKSTDLLARQEPWWQPGRTGGYHSLTIGHLIGAIVLRVTGKSLGTFLREELTRPLGVEHDLHIGTAEQYDRNVTLLIRGRPHDIPLGGAIPDKSLYNPRVTPEDSWTIAWRRAEMGAHNGHGNARGIAAVNSIVANGGAYGVRLMSDAGRLRAIEQQSDGPDLVLGFETKWGSTYSLTPEFLGHPGARAGWWGGNGGSMAYVDLDYRMAIGFAPNRWMGGDMQSLDRARRIIVAAYESLAQLPRARRAPVSAGA